MASGGVVVGGQGVATNSDPVPPPRHEAIERRRLLERLDSARATGVLLVAPAGYGKTTLLSQWAIGRQPAPAWITLDERHDDPVLLVRRIAEALAGDENLDESILAPLSGPAADLAPVVSRLCAELAERGPSPALVLDDLHRIEDESALRCVRTLVEEFPDDSRILIASRTEPGIGIGRLRANGRIEELGGRSLAMTRGEAAEAFGAMDRDLSFDLLQRLVELTEGWPAALYLAAATLGGEDDPARVVESFGGDERTVADYVRSEFLSRLEEGDRDFLLRTSILEGLNGELCDAVLEASGSGERLRRLSRSNLLLSPVDSKDREFRMHALMRETLRSELRMAEPESVPALHRRAAEWFAGEGRIDESVSHAIETGDAEFAADRIWSVTGEYSTQGRRATLMGWMESFSEEQVAAIPSLSMILAVRSLNIGDGDGAQAWSENAGRLLRARRGHPDPSLSAVIRVIAAIRTVGTPFASMVEEIEQAVDDFAEHSSWRSFCRLLQGMMLQLSGDSAGARRRLVKAQRLGAAAAPEMETLSHSQLCLMALDEGRDVDAEDCAAAAMARVELFGLEEYPTSATAFGVVALVRARRGDAAGALTPLAAAESLLDASGVVNGWYGAQTRLVLARAHLALGDRQEARARLREANDLLEPFPGAVVLDRWVTDLREALDPGADLDERWPLTPAELRLLHLLPTHLTFPEIASDLIVSTNTVKTQARSIYRKLGVSSRSEAVGCAQAAGLLGRDGTRSPRSD